MGNLSIPFQTNALTFILFTAFLLLSRPILTFLFDAIVTISTAYFNKWVQIARLWLRLKVKTRGLDYSRMKNIEIAFLVLEDWRLWGAISIIIGLLFFDPVQSVAAAVILGVGATIFLFMRRSERNRIINNDVENMIIQFASRYPITQSITKTLEDSLETVPPGDVRFALEQSITRIRIGANLDAAVLPLLDVPNSSARQFAMTVASAQRTSPPVLEDIFNNLKEDARNRTALIGEIRQSLTVLRITTYVLQAAFAIVLIIVSSYDQWTSYFTESLGNYMTFLVCAFSAVVASFYVEIEIQNRQE